MQLSMKKTEFHQLLQKANSPESELDELRKIVALGDEVLCSAVSLNPKCNKQLLDKLFALNMNEVNRNLSIRFATITQLYSLEVREVKVSDADYILKLRLNDFYSKYISKVSNEVNAQKKYLSRYLRDNSKSRESFYFIFTNIATGERCGTVRIYNFNVNTFEWGSWILDENKTRYAAMETGILIYEFAFNMLGFDKSE